MMKNKTVLFTQISLLLFSFVIFGTVAADDEDEQYGKQCGEMYNHFQAKRPEYSDPFMALIHRGQFNENVNLEEGSYSIQLTNKLPVPLRVYHLNNDGTKDLSQAAQTLFALSETCDKNGCSQMPFPFPIAVKKNQYILLVDAINGGYVALLQASAPISFEGGIGGYRGYTNVTY